MKKIELVFEISEKDLEFLNRIKIEGYAEFRDGSLDDYILREISRLEPNKFQEIKDNYQAFYDECKKSFLNRNFCLDDEIDNLVKYELVELNENSWHLTYKISNLGNQILEKQNLEIIKIEI